MNNIANEPPIAPFIRPEGHTCHVSSGVHDCLTFGTGELDDYGFWSEPCYECAREHERQFPECGFCWPHTNEQLKAMELLDDKTEAN